MSMNENTFWILTSLAGGRAHGYAVLRDVESLTDGAVSLPVTTLYASLERLERDGLVLRAGEEIVDGRARRYYDLTDAGIQILTLEKERLSVRLGAAEKRLAGTATTAGGTLPGSVLPGTSTAGRAVPGRAAPATLGWGFTG
ncbi:PadR family transcriptional regulator PadR [Arthrobacter sp. UYCu511]